MLHNFIKELHNSHYPMCVVPFNPELHNLTGIKDALYRKLVK